MILWGLGWEQAGQKRNRSLFLGDSSHFWAEKLAKISNICTTGTKILRGWFILRKIFQCFDENDEFETKIVNILVK